MIEYIFYSILAFVALILYAQPNYFHRLFDWILCRTPPGPFSFPLIGARGINSAAPWTTLAKWGNDHGGICSLFLGGEFTIVLTGKDVIKEAMLNPAFDGRPLNMASRKILKSMGLGYADGPFWTEQRRFCMATIKQLGGAPNRLEQEDSLQQAASELVAYMRTQNGQPFDCRPAFDRAVTTASVKFIQDGVISVHDDKFPRFIEALKEIFFMSENVGILNIIPWLRYVPPFRSVQKMLEKSLGDICIMTRENFQRRKEAGLLQFEAKDIMDAFLQKQAKEQPETTNYTDEQMEILLAEMLFAAIEDLIVVFIWLMVVMLNYPVVQQKCHAHIDKVVGRGRLPSLKDRPDLGYIDAVIWETLRFSNAVPFPFPRRIMETTQFRGYTLPKDSVVITNAYAVGFSREYWGDPEVFRPERFLNESGKFVQSSLILAFGAGRRVCVGMAYSQLQLFMFLTTLLQEFTLSSVEGKAVPSFDQFQFGIMLTPNDFELQAIPR